MLADIIPTHQAAQWLLVHIDRLLDHLGLEKAKGVEEWVYVIVIVLVALLIGWIIRRLILFGAKKFVRLRNSAAGRLMLQQRLMTKCSHVIPPLVVLALLPFAFDPASQLLRIFRVVLYIYTLVVAAMAICSVLTFLWIRFDQKENTNNLPLKGILNVGKGIVWIIVTVIAGSVLLGKTPGAFLAGLGAFAAALMLVFKDTILGLVASVQLTANKMLHRGDWIVMPRHDVNGEVLDVSLTTVKIRNWDNSVTTIPPYVLVSDSFSNYEPMRQSGGRRVDRSIYIDINTVGFCTQERIDRLRAAGRLEGVSDLRAAETVNLSLFRNYLERWLAAHPDVNEDMLLMVRQMEPTQAGLPVQLYFFLRTTEWKAFERVQSDIFDHVYAVIREFGLAIYQRPAGTDIIEASHPYCQ